MGRLSLQSVRGGLAIVGLFLLGGAVPAGADRPNLPAPVQQVLKTSYGQAAILEVEHEDEDGVERFAVQLSDGGKEVRLVLTAEGAICEISSDERLSDLSAEAKEAVLEAVKDGKVARIHKREFRGSIKDRSFVPLDPPKLRFDVEYVREDVRGEVVLTLDRVSGKLLVRKRNEEMIEGGDDEE